MKALREALTTDTSESDAQTLEQVSDELFAVVSLLSANGSLRRALSDPAMGSDLKQRLVDNLLAEKVSAPTLALVRLAARSRWSEPRDVVDALEAVAVDAAMTRAERENQLDEVEDELFRFERILEGEPSLRDALTNRSLPHDAKRQLLHKLLDGKVNTVSYTLIERAVLEPRGRTIERALSDLSALAAKRRERLIAHVTSAVELSDAEQRDLTAALSRTFGHELRLQIVVDSSLIGGLTVRVGDELIDASVARQLAEARRTLTGKN
jgi:F-type H+-transporting ATPase subunit delta